MEVVSADRDRISSLPEAIVHQIFSFLLIKDVIQTASTCKRLNQVWASLPYLDLGKDFFPALPLPPTRFDSDDDDEKPDMEALYPELPEIHSKREKMFTFVEQTLITRRMQGLMIQRIRICVKILDVDLSRHLDRWMHYLVQCNIKELVLVIRRGTMYYDLPSILFMATSLHTLTLKHCRMPVQCDSITLSSLRKLYLKGLYLADQTIGEIINTCHNLEDLNFKYCHGMKRIVVSGKPQLRVLTMRHLRQGQVLDEVVVEATNLEKLTYSTPSLMCKINIITKFDGRLKFLHLGGANITNIEFCKMMSGLPRLEELQLAQLNLHAITISSSSLKRLILVNLFDFGGSGVGGKVTIEAPNLAYFYFTGGFTTEFVTNVAAKEVVLQINDIDVEKNAEIMCRKWVQFLCKFDNSEVVRLDSLFFEKIVVPAKLKLLAPLPRIKHLIVEGRFDTSPVDVIGELIHSLIQISPNLETLSLEDNGYVNEASPINLVIKKIVVPAKLKLLAPLPRIKHLIVEGRFDTSPVDVIGELIHSLIQISPNLETLSLEDNGYVNEASPINLVIKKIVVPAKLKLLAPLPRIKHLIVEGRFDTSPVDVIGELIHSLIQISPNLETLSLEDNGYVNEASPINLVIKKIVVPAKLKLLAPLPRIKHLIVEGRFDTSPVDVIGELIHSLIQISPNLETLSLEDNGYVNEASPINLVIKFLYSEEVDCSITFPWRCQRGCVSHMKVNLNGTSDDEAVYSGLRNYFINNTELFGEIDGHCCVIRC